MPEPTTVPKPGAPPKAKLDRNVYAVSAVSFFTDASSEMIYPLLPVFLTTVLGANASFLGVIEGAAETTAALLKLASGWWSDRVRKRKPLIVGGYALASFVRPLIAIAQSAGQVLAIRVADRVGKGIRGAPATPSSPIRWTSRCAGGRSDSSAWRTTPARPSAP